MSRTRIFTKWSNTGEQLDAAAYKAFAKDWLKDSETTTARHEAMQLGDKNLYFQHVVQRLGRKDDAQEE